MAVDNFKNCLPHTLRWEGEKFTNDPRDPGGPTKWGVTQATLSLFLGRKASVREVANLSLETASEIYRKKYWDVIDGDHLPRGVDMLAFDIAVNMGPGRANPWVAASQHLKPREQVEYLDGRRRSFWKSLKTWAFYGKGWSRREDEIASIARKMAS